jgi:hypothetical protein
MERSDPDWIRTNDLQLRRLPLYPAELRDQWINEGAKIIFFSLQTKQY